ncbi:MAG: hypothetical protein ACREFO_10615 [Acetobacteraceae bacterium]
MDERSALADFVSAGRVAQRWDAARRLMAAKRLPASATDPEFTRSFEALASDAQQGDSLDRLLAVDLLVRISAAAKPLKKPATALLSAALAHPLPPVWMISEAAILPAGAKPAGVRENVALALTHASGDWVLTYLVQALAREDRSQRCRLQICRQMLVRETRVGEWLRALEREPWQEILPDNNPSEGRYTRLRDLALALLEALRASRTLTVLGPEDGESLSRLARTAARVPPRVLPGPRLAAAASAVVRLLDEMIAAESALATDPRSYAVLETIQGWWRPQPFPKGLVQDLVQVKRRLESAITLRARMGQRSESLAMRLRQALGPGARGGDALTRIADATEGLTGDVDDWLRGRLRSASATAKAASALLEAASSGDFIAAFAPLLLDSKEAREGTSGQLPDLLRICNRIDAIAMTLGFVISGRPGDIVEYNPVLHSTVDGSAPPDPLVRIIRPSVVRERIAGSRDVVVRAVVVPASAASPEKS